LTDAVIARAARPEAISCGFRFADQKPAKGGFNTVGDAHPTLLHK